jgi:ribosomal protein S18 acetylase RimI-like enzyme
MSLQIIPFNPKYISDFRDLNLAWLEKYFYVEPKDTELLENCEKSIINKGGSIFFAKYDTNIVGCLAFIRLNDTTYELGKMAVHPNYQGLKIGQKLLSYALAFAKNNKYAKLELYSSTKLPAALYIYKKYGFKEIALEKESPYSRSDIKMELQLSI